MEIRVLTEMHDLKKVQAVEKQIWQSEDDVVSPIIMRVTVTKGGVVLAAYDDDRMIGILWGFPVRKDNRCILWSHVTGVLPEYQGQRVGYALKQHQRLWALDHDYDAIHWTFDPMRSQNANFNLRRLGVTVSTYHENVYGEINDALNIGLPSDRFEAEWNLNDAHVMKLSDPAVQAELPVKDYAMKDSSMLVMVEEHSVTTNIPQHWQEPYYFLEIPAHFENQMRQNPDYVRQWQTALRTSAVSALQNGYSIVDFIRQDGRYWYVLSVK